MPFSLSPVISRRWIFALLPTPLVAMPLMLNPLEYFAADGVNVLVYSSWYNSNFSDSKISGIEVIHFGERTVTNGDVRLNRTPEQWDPIPDFVARRVLPAEGVIEADLAYPAYDFNYTIRVEARPEGGVNLSVILDKPLPEALLGRAALHLEFLPSAYFGAPYLMDEAIGLLPHYAEGEMEMIEGRPEPLPLAEGQQLVFAPHDPQRRITLHSAGTPLRLYDGRNQAQNGWLVVQSLLPAGATGRVISWDLIPATAEGWLRPPVISYSQVGYHPVQEKVALVELDARAKPEAEIELRRIHADGTRESVLRRAPQSRNNYQRYHYLAFDFSEIRAEGLYEIVYGDSVSAPLPIAATVYDRIWQPTLDLFFPIQMDHMRVNEAYRVWHGASHLDDARQAPVDHEHFDLYAQGPSTDTPFAPGEHIPGLNLGGWYDAGDYDIRTQSQTFVLHHLINTWEHFQLDRDQTHVDQAARFVDIHRPDGRPDLLQQIEHGVLALLAQYRAIGHAIPGIVAPTLDQYTHLGDGATKTDNLIYDPSMGPLESDGVYSGLPDDRWAFTTHTTALNYGSAAALAAASRVLRGYDDALAEECLTTALGVWERETTSEPARFRHGNTTGGAIENEHFKAAVELLITTGEPRFAEAIDALWEANQPSFGTIASFAVRALPQRDEAYRARLEAAALAWKAARSEDRLVQNPFGVAITETGWAGVGRVIGESINAYFLQSIFPEHFSAEDVFAGLHYTLGRHPDHNLSLVTGVGAQTKKVAYGMNRADFSYIPGGIVPGILILPPDFPENKEDWPFLWGQNEYVITVGASYLFLARAALDLLGR